MLRPQVLDEVIEDAKPFGNFTILENRVGSLQGSMNISVCGVFFKKIKKSTKSQKRGEHFQHELFQSFSSVSSNRLLRNPLSNSGYGSFEDQLRTPQLDYVSTDLKGSIQ